MKHSVYSYQNYCNKERNRPSSDSKQAVICSIIPELCDFKQKSAQCLRVQSTAPRAERSAETSSRLQIAYSVDEGLSIKRTLQADSAPPDTLRGLSGDNFRFTVAHADRGLFEVERKAI